MYRWKRRKYERRRRLHRLHVLEVRVEPGPPRSSPSFPYEVPFCGEISEIWSGDGPINTTKIYKRKFVSWSGNKTKVASCFGVVIVQKFLKNAKILNFLHYQTFSCLSLAFAGNSIFCYNCEVFYFIFHFSTTEKYVQKSKCMTATIILVVVV